MTEARYRVLLYGSDNLGDTLQCATLTRLLPSPTVGVLREPTEGHKASELPIVMSGWIGQPLPAYGLRCTLAGVHLHYDAKKYVPWLQILRVRIGARDPSMVERFKRIGMDTELVGDPTLTLDPYDGPREGEYAVDCKEAGEQITHICDRTLPTSERWKTSMELLEKYRTAKLVKTSRLHVVLPCLAFGTPVEAYPIGKSMRWTLFEHMGGEYGKTTRMDVSSWRRRYVSFLEECLGETIVPHDPVRPL